MFHLYVNRLVATKALLFIPDISGFTEFVHNTATNHSKHIISELLEVLLDAISINLELAEIEGDALFLYKLTDHINKEDLQSQINQMYLAFHTHLKRYEFERICHCGACSSAYNLTLKFVLHYGEIDFITVKDSKKPYGSHVIKAHRMLKNNIPIKEYALWSEDLVAIGSDSENVLNETYDFGTINYTYTSLEHLKTNIPKVDPIPNDVPRSKLLSIETLIKSDTLDLYEVISNFDYRLLWVQGLDALEYEKNKVNRSGTKHQCLINNNQKINQTTVHREVEDHQLVYGESTNEIPFTKRVTIYYILEEKEPHETALQVQVYADFKPLGILMKPLLVKNLKKNIKNNIDELVNLINSGFAIETQ